MRLRSKQIKDLLTSPYFSSTKLMEESVYRRFSSEKNISFFMDRAFHGLTPSELPVKASIEQYALEVNEVGKTNARLLLIGCGTGREAFALEDLPIEIFAMDIVPQMIESARACAEMIDSRVHFFCNCFPNLNDLNEHRVELIFISSYVLNFIQGSENRVHYLAKLRNLLSENGRIYIRPSIKKIPFFSSKYFISKLLKLSSWLHGWDYEKGDHAISNFPTEGEAMYFYHYPNENEFRQEVAKAVIHLNA